MHRGGGIPVTFLTHLLIENQMDKTSIDPLVYSTSCEIENEGCYH
jgi:hypothetical protein